VLDPLYDAMLEQYSLAGESKQQQLARLRYADNRLRALYRCEDVIAIDAYSDPLIRAAYLLRYLPHYTLQISGLQGDLSRPPQAAEAALLACAQVLSLMNALNELMRLGVSRLRKVLAQRLSALPSGSRSC
jgi:hypothetical protein